MTRETLLYRLLVAAWTAQFALLMAWYLALAPPPEALRAPVLVAVVAPWLLPLRGMLRKRRYTIAWSSLLVLGYVLHAAVNAAGLPPGRWLGVAELATSLLYFTAVMLYMRLTRTPAAAAKA